MGRLLSALERRGAPGTATATDLDLLVDGLLDDVVPDQGEDDVALLALRLLAP